VTTQEGREVVIPNAIIFTNPVAVGHNNGENPESCAPGHQKLGDRGSQSSVRAPQANAYCERPAACVESVWIGLLSPARAVAKNCPFSQ